MKGKVRTIEEDADQTFQDGTLDDGIIPSPGGLRGGNSPNWLKPVRAQGHAGGTDE